MNPVPLGKGKKLATVVAALNTHDSIGCRHGTGNQCPPARNCPLVAKGTYTSCYLLRLSQKDFQPRRQRSTSTSCSSKAPKASSLGMIKPRSADRGICLKVLCSVRSTLGAWVEPTSPSSISMMLVASIWATSIERRICGKSTARSSPISSKTSKTKQDGFCHLHKVSQCPPMFVILLVTSTPNATVSCKSTANALTQPRCFPYPCCYVSIDVSPLLPSI